MIWGLTGCSGTGVSTVAAVWNEMGANVCSLDKVGHRFLKKYSVKQALENELGIEGLSEMSQEAIRQLLREEAFASGEVLTGINRVLHPRLSKWVANAAVKFRNSSGVFVLDAALIFELGLNGCMSYMITVTDQLDRVTGRLVERDGISADTVIGRWNSQLDLNEKTRKSHFVISNSGTEDMLKMKAENFYKDVIQRMEDAQWHTEPEKNLLRRK